MTQGDSERVEEKVRHVVLSLSADLQLRAAALPIPLLHSACVAEELELVQALIDSGVAPDLYPETEDEDDEPPLTWMARYRDTSSPRGLEVVRYLIEQASDVSEGNPLLAALEWGDVSMARLLLAAGADTSEVDEATSPNESTLLHALLQPYWRAEVETVPRYYIAFDEDQEICGVGFKESDAMQRAAPKSNGRLLKMQLAEEALVARHLIGETLSWKGDEIAELDEDS